MLNTTHVYLRIQIIISILVSMNIEPYVPMRVLSISFLIFLQLLFINGIMAQDDCILGVGITEDQTLIDIFQLNEAQTEKFMNFSAELKYRNELLNNQADNILKRHPQSSEAELMVLSGIVYPVFSV